MALFNATTWFEHVSQHKDKACSDHSLFQTNYLSNPMTICTSALQVSSSTPDIPLSPPSQPDIQPGTRVPEPEMPQPSTEPEVPQQPNDPIIIEPTVPEISPIQS